MKQVKVIIGAGFGDEGKGLVTSQLIKQLPGKSLNVLYNGGPQRGHTSKDFVFHAFGVGANEGTETMYYDTFMTNPIALAQEFINFQNYDKNFKFNPVSIQNNSPLTLPHDVLINRTIERVRSNNRHGSCGMGIYETYLRHKKFPLYASDMLDQFSLYYKIQRIEKEYIPTRLKQLGLTWDQVFGSSSIGSTHEDIVTPTGIIKADSPFSIDGFFEACNICAKEDLYKLTNNNPKKIPANFNNYDNILFEAGQGLLLDEDNVEFFPNVTGSSTGSKYIASLINAIPTTIPVEVIYVTRSYMTRHGVGKFDTECDKALINPTIIDNTNKKNEFQGELRYGLLDIPLILKYIKKDLAYYTRPIKKSLAVTHLNYTNGLLATNTGWYPIQDCMGKYFNSIYTSYAKDSLML